MSKAATYLVKKRIKKLNRKIVILENTITFLFVGIFGYILTVNLF